MDAVRLLLFTSLWTAIWVAPLPKLSPRVELAAGLVPFAAFGLRVFAGFFTGVPEDDAVRSAVAPLVEWVTGGPGLVPYQPVLDATVAAGMAWLASAFDIPARSRVATAWIMPTVAIASVASLRLTGMPPERFLAATLPAPVLAAAAGGLIAALVRWTPGPIDAAIRRRAALVACVTVPMAVIVARGLSPVPRIAAVASSLALAAGVGAGLTAWTCGGFRRQRSRLFFAMAVGVAAGALTGATAAPVPADHGGPGPEAPGGLGTPRSPGAMAALQSPAGGQRVPGETSRCACSGCGRSVS